MYESQAKRYRAEMEKQQGKRATADKKVADAEAAAMRYEQAASRTSSASIARSKIQQAERKRKEAAQARESGAKASKAITDAQKKLHEAERKLAAAKAKEVRSRAQREEREQARAGRRRRAVEREREAELERLRAGHAELESQLAAEPWANAPEEIRVLFIAANPEDQDQDPLRLDQEVAEIQRRLRMAEHRDSIQFAWRPAARTLELMQYLNEHRPHVVHFSGHSDQHGLAFEDADGLTKMLDSAQLSNLLTVASERIRLAIFNSCESSAHAESACDYIDAAIGMEQNVGDTSAKIFAAQFYNSLGFGHSLKKAFDQARVQLEIETGGASGNPQLFVAPGLDAGEIYLVAPPEIGQAPEAPGLP
jgi:hypothetical protein